MKLNTLLLFSFLILFLSCKNDKKTVNTSDPSTIENSLKDISEFTYLDIYKALFIDNNGGFDAHGDLYGQGAISSLSLSEENSSCGKALFLSNNSLENEITLAVKASFNFPGNPTHEMLRAYTLNSNEKISIGNSKLCYNGKEYDVKREIVSAGITKD